MEQLNTAKKEKQWINAKLKKPRLTMTLGPADNAFQHSNCVIGYYSERYHKSDRIEELKHRLLIFEKGLTKIYNRWYCPVVRQYVEAPDAWLPIAEYDGNR